MSTYAEASDVLARWGKSSDATDDDLIALINVRLADAERMIKRRFKALVPPRDLDADVADGTIDVDDLKQVEAEAVLRMARNPDGYQSETDGTYNYMFRQDMATGILEILPEEWVILGIIQSNLILIVPTAVVQQ